MKREEFIEMLFNYTEENISMAYCKEDAIDAEEGNPEGCTYTPVLESVNGRLYIVCGDQETG